MALNLYFLNRKKDPINKINSIGLKLFNCMPCKFVLNKPNTSIDKPAEAIIATTAGRRADNTSCTPLKLRYL